MKAIFINAKEQTVSIVENKGQLEDLYNTLGVNMVEIGRFYENGDTLWVDEEGLINGTDFGFQLDGIDYMGNGLIYGTNRMNPELNDSAVTDMKKLKLKFFTLQFA
jgi:hypothetical protein